MTTGGKQHDRRRLVVGELEARCIEVALHVVDPIERLLERPRQRLAERETDHQRTDKPGTLRRSDCVQLVGVNTGRRERLVHKRTYRFDMSPGRDFGYDAAEAGVLLGLGCENK